MALLQMIDGLVKNRNDNLDTHVLLYILHCTCMNCCHVVIFRLEHPLQKRVIKGSV